MDVAVGAFVAAFGLLFAVFASRFSRAGANSSKAISGTSGGRWMGVWNRIVFVVVGLFLALFGLLYAIGGAG
ncbi:hypothetical protein [Streptomyces ambofaciens]|uniref:hypothetical protein n=1 Tax=Streptomyces ambofaciens TaxID=1889 RepID=UPI00069E63EB|nr:hypothetical protein [Streptomyces ambofaciens]